MSLAPGSTIGPYEIVSLLGTGGMGEVYRARDPRLRRHVALKVLPATAAADPERRERFTREALAVAALNHPHIVTIYSVESAGNAAFLTMELIEGRSLAEALPSGGLPLDRVLAIGIAVADAVAAAHQKGITHRDLKPANVMLGEGDHAGRIKVLDFGLAKAVDGALGAAAVDMLATKSEPPAAPATAEGRIVGTVAYMSPEQAEGRPVDGRSDLFSLGVVLYEIATGRRPFTGDTNLSILSSILRDTPQPASDINPALPRDFGRIVRRALAKDPERRYQTAKDLRNDLEDLKASLDSGEIAPPHPASPGTGATIPPAGSSSTTLSGPSSDTQVAAALVRRYPMTLAAGVALVLVAAVAFVWFQRDTQPTADAQNSPASSLADLPATQITSSGTASRPAISPDGQYVAYVQRDGNDDSLWIRQTTNTSSQQLVAPEPGVTFHGATFTPDGTSVDFVRQATDAPVWDIWRVPILGGTPRPFIANVTSPISWSPDGRRLAFLRNQFRPESSQLVVADADGTGERTLARTPDKEAWITLFAPWRPSFGPAWSLDGQRLAVIAVNPQRGSIPLIDSQTGAREDIGVAAGTIGQVGTIDGLDWIDDRSLVLNQMTNLNVRNQMYRMPYPAGPVTRLTNDPNDYVGLSLSRDRQSLVTASRHTTMEVWSGDAGGTKGKTVAERVPIPLVQRIAWAGDRLLFGGLTGGRPAILHVGPDGGAAEGVIADAVGPAATGDGRTIAFVSARSSESNDLWTADANGRRLTQLVPGVTLQPLAITPDDRSVLYVRFEGKPVIWTVPLAGGTPTKIIDGDLAVISPNGASIAFISTDEDNRTLMKVCSLPGCASPRTVGPAAQNVPFSWTPDGGGIAFARGGNLWVQPLAGGLPRQLTRFADSRPIGSFAWSRDGQRLAITRATVTHDIVLFRGLK